MVFGRVRWVRVYSGNLIVADYTTGIMKSIAERRVSSQIGAKGILKKCLMFILIGLSNLIDQYLLLDLGVLRTIVVFFYISNEGISILENANALGLPIPFKLKNLLQQIKDKAIHDKEAGKTGDAPESNSKHHVNRKPNATCKNDSASDTQSNQQ